MPGSTFKEWSVAGRRKTAEENRKVGEYGSRGNENILVNAVAEIGNMWKRRMWWFTGGKAKIVCPVLRLRMMMESALSVT